MPKNTRIIVLFSSNHKLWDAMSSRQFVGDLLRQTGASWIKKETPAEGAKIYSWVEETSNLKSSVKALGSKELFSVDECIFLLDTYESDM